MLLEIDLLTLSMGVGLKLPPFINPVGGQMGSRVPCFCYEGLPLVAF